MLIFDSHIPPLHTYTHPPAPNRSIFCFHLYFDVLHWRNFLRYQFLYVGANHPARWEWASKGMESNFQWRDQKAVYSCYNGLAIEWTNVILFSIYVKTNACETHRSDSFLCHLTHYSVGMENCKVWISRKQQIDMGRSRFMNGVAVMIYLHQMVRA